MRTVGLALGGGAARGLAEIGVLKVLEEEGISVGWIAGTSIGSIVGGLYASGLSAKKIETLALSIDLPQAVQMFTPSFSHSGLINGKNVTKMLRKYLEGDKKIEDLKIPYCAVATDFMKGVSRAFSKGSLLEAIRASMSIPVVFTPAVKEGTLYIDGILSDPIPTDLVRKMGAKTVISVSVVPKPDFERQQREEKGKLTRMLLKGLEDWNLQPFRKWKKQFMKIRFSGNKKILPNMMDVAMQTTQMAEYGLGKFDLEVHPPDILLEPNKDSTVGWFDFNRAAEIIENGEKACRASLDRIHKKIHTLF